MRVKEKLRYELKYVLTAEQAAAVRADLASYVEPDEHGDAQGAYRITSLYYDTPDYRAYWDKLEGHKVRRKVRVRIYGDTWRMADASCYLEIKHRVNQRMGKRRAQAALCACHRLCGLGGAPDAASLTMTPTGPSCRRSAFCMLHCDWSRRASCATIAWRSTATPAIRICASPLTPICAAARVA